MSGACSPPVSARRADVLALVLLALLALVFFWPVTLNLGWIPRGGGDLVSLLWPHYSYAASSLHAGRLPFWDPSLFSGAPFAADNQTSLFYPVNLIAFLLAPSLPYTVMEWLVVFHFWLAGASMYFCMRILLADFGASGSPGSASSPSAARHFSFPSSFSLSPFPFFLFPCLFSAVAFMFSEVFVTHIGNLNLDAASAWVPAAFAALHLALTRRSPAWAVGAGMMVSLCILAGHMQMTFIGLAGLGLYALWHFAWGASWRERLRLAGLTALAFGVALGLTAFVLLPGLELAPMTARTKLSYAAAASFSIPWPGLAGLFSPLVFGRGPANFWGPWDRVEVGYLGVLPLLFAGLAPFKRRSSPAVFFGLLGGFALLVALGSNTPVHRLLYLLVPGLSGMRVPARFVLLTDFSLAALGGLGLYNLVLVSRRRVLAWSALLAGAAFIAVLASYRWAVAVAGVPHAAALQHGLTVLAGLLAVGAALALFGGKLPRAAPLLAVAVLAVDLIGQGAGLEVDATDPTLGFQHPKVTAFLQAQPGPLRIDSTPGWWAPATSARYGLESITGVDHALVLAAYQTYLGAMGPRGAPLYNFLNAQFVVADKGQPPGDASLVPIFDEDPQVDVYLNTNAMPRVSLAYSATIVPNGEAAFGAIHAPQFNPAQAVVIESGPAPGGGQQGGNQPLSASNLSYNWYLPESISVAALTPAAAYLVFSEVWYPGWRAWVDGVEAPIYRANFAFRGVYLASAGSYTVVLRYDPPSWKIGGLITLLTLAGPGGWWLYARRRRLNTDTQSSRSL